MDPNDESKVVVVKNMARCKYEWKIITSEFFEAIKELKIGELMQGNLYGKDFGMS
jgi:hypothetical protein